MKGKVIIAGAGPGDPELLTLKAAGYLQLADVVLADRLVSEAILYQWVNPKAELIFVGKEGYNQHSFSQQKINELLLEYALQDKLVVRLKGGDVALFSNVLDELLTLSAHHIPYEIVPGITAASGASAYAGIPLTARGYARGVRMIACNPSDLPDDAYWQELAHTDDTLVLYMGGEQLPVIAEALQRQGMGSEKKVAVIEQATTPQQKITVYELADLGPGKIKQRLVAPSLIIIGKVVALQEQFHWYLCEQARQSYFRPVQVTPIHQLR